MSQKIDPREVLTYLNELGYTNISAYQLKEFIIDLKKLIKYDSRYQDYPDTQEKVTRVQSYSLGESEYCQCSESQEGFDQNGHNNYAKSDNENQTDNSYSYLHAQQTASKAKEAAKDKHILVHISQSKSRKNVLHEHCVHVNYDNVDVDTVPGKLKLVKNVTSSGPSKIETTESTIKSIRPSSMKESRTSSKDRKSKVSFIRPASRKPSINKCDPVALYHYYQSEWKRSKIPGQDNRDDLRWAIREKMLGGPRVEIRTRSRCSSYR